MDKASIFEIRDERDLEEAAFQLFREQATEVAPYRDFLALLNVRARGPQRLEEIPYFPVRFFKGHRVLRDGMEAEHLFRSSGTTDVNEQAHHYVADLALYDRSWYTAFERLYGDPSTYRILALLPSYTERRDASLVHMVQGLMEASGHAENAFYLYEHDALAQELEALEAKGVPTLLIGVSFALLDLVEQYPMELEHTIVMETGGMKGRRREMVRPELHLHLRKGFGVDRIHSEYGMTEMLSQAYAQGNGIFYPPPWMKVLVREIEDPFSFLPPGRTGALCVIDLANQDSCAFLALDDLGRVHEDGSFEVIGRMDGSDLRGCNLMWEGE